MKSSFGEDALPACQVRKRDESGVVTRELVLLMREVGMPDSFEELAARSGVGTRILRRIFGTTKQPSDQPFTSLLTADRLLGALEVEHRLHELTIIPNCNMADARMIATYEFTDDDTDEMTGTSDQIEVRALELMALRETMIGDELRRLAPQRQKESDDRSARKKRASGVAPV